MHENFQACFLSICVFSPDAPISLDSGYIHSSDSYLLVLKQTINNKITNITYETAQHAT